MDFRSFWYNGLMLENNRLNQLMLRFPEDVQLIFNEMIPSYQLGYADYVYQTDDVATQNRRIKNLAKNFRKMDYFYVMSLPQDLALEIANQWQYPSPYDFYSVSSQSETYTQFITPEARGDRFFAVIRNAALMGYFQVEQVDKELSLHLGMKPFLMGQGNGRAFYQTIEDYIVEHYHPEQLSLSVAICNQRAQALFRAVGFSVNGHSIQVCGGNHYECVRMEKKLACD